MPSGTRFDLIDRGGCRLACVTVTECDGDLVHGVMEDALSVHNEIFGEWYRAVEEQRLADVDRLDQQIAALSITAVEVPGGGRLATGDLQIWPDGSLTFRLGPPVAAGNKSNVA